MYVVNGIYGCSLTSGLLGRNVVVCKVGVLLMFVPGGYGLASFRTPYALQLLGPPLRN